LHALQSLCAFTNVREEDVRPKYWRNHGSNTIKGLRDIDAQF
jgi:hypothetical protein